MLRLLPASCLILSSCQPTSIDPTATAIVKEVRIPKSMPWYARFASHSYIDFRPDPTASWQRIEIINKDSGLKSYPISEEEAHRTKRWGNPVRLVSQSHHEASSLASQIQTVASQYDASLYRPWPGPNSNTFTNHLLLEVEGLNGVLDHNGVGKDFTWALGPTAGGTGAEIQSPLLGMEAGIREGLNLNFLGLTAGIGIWPPSLKLPILPQIPPRPSSTEASP